MNKKNTLIGIGAVAVAVALAASLVSAQGRPDPARGGGGFGRGMQMGPHGPGRGFGPGLGGLDLSEEQRSKVAEIHRAAREQAAPIEKELRAAQQTLHRELFADARDASKIADVSAKVSTLQKQLAELHVKTTTAVSDVLTAEQRASVREREGRGGPGRGGPGRGRGRPHFGGGFVR